MNTFIFNKGLSFIIFFSLIALFFINNYIKKNFFSSIYNHVKSQIIESNHLSEVMNHIDNSNMLVMFDIDNTLVAPDQDFGSDLWFSHITQKKVLEGLSNHEAVEVILPTYVQLQMNMYLYPIEKDTYKIIEELQRKKIPTIAITARSYPIIDRTIQQLEQAGISFLESQFSPQELPFELDFQGMFKKGILFCSQNDKGKTLFYLLDKLNYHPEKILFVDDKISHIISVEKACILQDIRYVGIRYSRLDERVKNFNATLAEKEYELFLTKGTIAPLARNS